MATNRRSFLKSAGAAAAVVSAAPLGLAVREDGPATVADAAVQPRAYVSGYFALSLDGIDESSTDVLLGYAGGFPYGKVGVFQEGSGGPPDKFISGVGVADIVFQVGAELSPTLRAWVAEMVSGAATVDSKKNGAILFLDEKLNLQHRLNFTGALVTEVTFPACDAASKDPLFLTIVISPESSEYVPGGGKVVLPVSAKQKKWLASNFRVSVGGLPTQRVSKVDALTVKQPVVEFNDGTTRLPQKLPGKLELPNLVITLAATDSQPWFDYFSQFVLQGTGTERQGMLEYLAADLASPLFAVQLHNLGIVTCQPEHADSASDKVAKTTAGMYLEGISLPAVQ
jgi:hypothetical protein